MMPCPEPRGGNASALQRNHRTLWRELEKLIELENLDQPLDPLAEAMRKTPDATLTEIAKMYERAGKFAALAAPYRHGRLSAMKLIGDPNAGAAFRPDATLDELRAELGKRVLEMAKAGLVDLTALPQPENSATAAQSVGAK